MSSKRGVPIYDARKALRQERLPHTAAEEAELVQFLTNNGFAQYAAPAFIQEMKDTLGYGSLEDLGALEDDDAHLQVGMPEEHAEAIQEAALKELLRRFLANLESPTGGSMVKHLERLVEHGYEDIEDLEDIEADEADELGLTQAEIDTLIAKAELNTARVVLTGLLRLHRDSSGFPFRDTEVYQPMLDALIDADVTDLEDIAGLKPGQVKGLSDENLTKLQSDPRVLEMVNKSEL